MSPQIREYITRVKPIRFRRDYLHDRILIVDEGELARAEFLGLREVSIEPEDFHDYTLVLSTVGYGIDVELSPAQIAPELYVPPLGEQENFGGVGQDWGAHRKGERRREDIIGTRRT